MSIDTSRRGFLFGLTASIIAAPAIVRAASLMPVRGIIAPISLDGVQLQFTQPSPFPVWQELAEITRQAFLPRMHRQLYSSTDLARMLEQ